MKLLILWSASFWKYIDKRSVKGLVIRRFIELFIKKFLYAHVVTWYSQTSISRATIYHFTIPLLLPGLLFSPKNQVWINVNNNSIYHAFLFTVRIRLSPKGRVNEGVTVSGRCTYENFKLLAMTIWCFPNLTVCFVMAIPFTRPPHPWLISKFYITPLIRTF